MSVGNLATALSVIFMVFIVALAGELLYVLWHHRSFRRRSSPAPPIHTHDQTPNSSITEASTKELLYFFYFKPHIPPVELHPPEALTNVKHRSSSPDDQVVDVCKLLDANGQQDKEQVEMKPATAEAVAVTVGGDDGNTKTVYSTPCDSPVFFTPVGSPSRDFVESELVVSVHETGDSDDR